MQPIVENHHNDYGHPSHVYSIDAADGDRRASLVLVVVETEERNVTAIRMNGRRIWGPKDLKDDMRLYMQYMRLATIEKTWKEKKRKKKKI